MGRFQKATKKSARLRLALIGPSGSGKTYTALSIAEGLGKRVALIDTERGSASKYADIFEFDALGLETHGPLDYVRAIADAEDEGFDVVIIDSLSHAWVGKGGALEQVDNAAKRQRGNSFGAWRDVTPQHNALIDAIVGAKLHVIATMRSKTEYVQEKDERSGKTVVRKVGMAPVQRDGMEYEFDLVADLDQDNNLIVSKSRCPAMTGQVVRRAGLDVAATLREWLTDGVASVDEPTKTRTPLAEIRDDDGSADIIARLNACVTQLDLDAIMPDLAKAKRNRDKMRGFADVVKAFEVARNRVAEPVEREPGSDDGEDGGNA